MATKEEADKVLHAHRTWKACYPCAKRKVKCTGIYPCSTCIQRGHPEICIVESPRRRRRPAERQRADRRNSHASASTSTPAPGSPMKDEPRSDRHLSVSFGLRQTPSGSDSSVALPPTNTVEAGGVSLQLSRSSSSAIDPASALSNDPISNLPIHGTNVFSHWSGQYPPQSDNTRAVNNMIPAHGDILKFSHLYQSVFSPFIPLLVDNNEVDTVICKFLERAAIRESMGSLIFDGPVTQLELAEAAMLMAALGRGVQVSDLDADTRTRLSREYSRRAFHLARLANFMLRPNLQTLQALLLVQNVMQNAGQPDAAWCLLGTLIRLAQSIGLHQHPGATVSPSDQARYSRIWSMLLWQDTSLSLCLDRPPTNMLPIHLFKSTRPTSMVLNYLEYTDELVTWCHMIMELSPETRNSIDSMLAHVAELEHIHARGAPHLRSRALCTSHQSRIEHYLIRLNTALGFRLACRGAIKRTGPPERAGEHAAILTRLREALKENLQAYLDLCSLTLLPLRQWSTLHETLSSAMLMEYSNFAATDRDAHELLSRFVNVVSPHVAQTTTTPEDDLSDENGPVTSHVRALRALRQSIDRREELARSGSFASSRTGSIADNLVHQPKMISAEPLQDVRGSTSDIHQHFAMSYSPLLSAMPSVPALHYTSFAPQEYDNLEWTWL